MVGIGGQGAEVASRLLSEMDMDVLVLDTDRRALEDIPEENSLLVGEQVVKGEGTGGNLNTAKACFKLSMEGIAPKVLGRPLVVTVASASGSTGAAGSVEVVQFLSKVGLPTFSVLVHGGQLPNDKGPDHMTEVLLDGPLRPGSLVSINDMGKDELAHILRNLLKGSMEKNEFPVPVSAWGLLRESKGPFRLVHIADLSSRPDISFEPPGILVLKMPKGQTVEGSRELINGMVSEPDGMGVGIMLSETAEKVSLFAVVPQRSEPHHEPGPRMDPERTMDAIGSELGSEMGIVREHDQEIH